MPVIQHGFLRSKENVVPAILNTKRGVWENVIPQYLQYLCMIEVIIIHIGRSYCLGSCYCLRYCDSCYCTGRCYCQHYLYYIDLWQMLLPRVEVNPSYTRQMFFAFVVVDVNHM